MATPLTVNTDRDAEAATPPTSGAELDTGTGAESVSSLAAGGGVVRKWLSPRG